MRADVTTCLPLAEIGSCGSAACKTESSRIILLKQSMSIIWHRKERLLPMLCRLLRAGWWRSSTVMTFPSPFRCSREQREISWQTKERRFDFFDKYNEAYFAALIPDDLSCGFLGKGPIGATVKAKMHVLLEKLRALPTDPAWYGMIHFDYSDGNYNIGYDTGTITVYDFDNCRTGWYLFDLANLWTHAVGWIAWNRDADERRRFMEHCFDGRRCFDTRLLFR